MTVLSAARDTELLQRLITFIPGSAGLWCDNTLVASTGLFASAIEACGGDPCEAIATTLAPSDPDLQDLLRLFLAAPIEGELPFQLPMRHRDRLSWHALGEGAYLLRLIEAPQPAPDSARRARFLAQVIHELRTPLASMLGFAELLMDLTPLDPTQRRYVEHIVEEGRHQNALVDDLLSATTAEAGKLRMVAVPTDLAPILRDAGEAFHARYPDRPFTAALPEALPAVADPARLREIVDNLLENAGRYAVGPVHLSAAMHGGEIRIGVADGGPGIAAESLSRLFEPFYRGDDPKGKGAGLGLSIAAAIASAHGGRLWAESAPGRGSTFWIALPARPAHPAA